MGTLVSTIGLALIIGAIVVLAVAMLLRQRSGLPWAEVIASDMSSWQSMAQPLFSPRLGLTGKPDYILRHGKALIPVEVKPHRYANQPYLSDLMQLAAYLVLLEETTGVAPPYGLLRYAEATFELRYTAAVRAEVLTTLDEMRDLLAASNVERSHEEAARCHGCGLRAQCSDALR